LANHNSTHDDRRKGQPSWGYLIVLALIAIVLLNLLAATILLLMQPTPERYWFLGSVWTVALIGLTQLPRLRRTMALQRTSPRRGRPQWHSVPSKIERPRAASSR